MGKNLTEESLKKSHTSVLEKKYAYQLQYK